LARVVVDSVSLDLLSGSELDYTDELMGSHFAVRNPNAKSACGCGTSFSVD
jgi:iron-sulfur cluster insertion protein